MSTLEDYKNSAKDRSCSKCWFSGLCGAKPSNNTLMYVRIANGGDERLLKDIANECDRYTYSVAMEAHKSDVLKTEDSYIFGV